MATTVRQYVPELGAIVSFPSDITQEQRQEFIDRTLAQRGISAAQPAPPPPPSAGPLKQVSDFLLGTGSGVISGVAGIPEGIGGITGTELPIALGRAIRENPIAEFFQAAPGEQPTTGRQVGEVLGNLATYLTPGLIAKGPKLAMMAGTGMGVLGGAAEQVRNIEAERAAGRTDISPEQQQLAAILGGATGFAEALPIGRVFKGVDRTMRGIAGQGLLGGLRQATGTGLVEGGTEVLQSLGQDVITQQVYKPEQVIGEDVMRSAVAGAGAGILIDGVAQILGGRIARKAMAQKEEMLGRAPQAQGPDVKPGDQEAIAITMDADGNPKVVYVPKAAPRFETMGTQNLPENLRRTPTPAEPIPQAGVPPFRPTQSTLDPQLEAITQQLAERERQMYASGMGGPVSSTSDIARVLAATPEPGAPIPGPVPTMTPMAQGMTPTTYYGMPTPIVPAETAMPVVPETPVETVPPTPTTPVSPEVMLGQQQARPAAQEPSTGIAPGSILDQILNPAPPRQPTPIPQVRLGPEGTLVQPSGLYRDLPRRERGTGIPVTPMTQLGIQERLDLAQAERVRMEQRRTQERARVQQEQAEQARVQQEEQRIRREEERRRLDAAPRAPVTVPETGIPNERTLDARQRLARETFAKNLDQLTPDELSIVEAQRQQGLGTAVRPQEAAEIREFADLPFTRGQYRQAIEIGKSTTARNFPKKLSSSLGISRDSAQQMMDTMVSRGDATVSNGEIKVSPTATGPRYSIQPEAATAEAATTTTPTPTEPTYTVRGFAQQLEAGTVPEVPLGLYNELKRYGVEDLFATRLIDKFSDPSVEGSQLDRIITLALAGRNVNQLKSVLSEETIHAMKRLGFFTDAEWSILRQAFDPNVILDDEQRKAYEKAYAGNREMIEEEGIAKGMRQYLDQKRELPPEVADVVDAKVRDLGALGTALQNQDLDSSQRIMEAFRTGEMGRRQAPGLETAAGGFETGQETVGTGRARGGTETVAARGEAPTTRGGTDLADYLMDTTAEGLVVPKQGKAEVPGQGEAEKPTDTTRLSIAQKPVPNPLFTPVKEKSWRDRLTDVFLGAKAAITPGQRSLSETKALKTRYEIADARAPIEEIARRAGTIQDANVSSIAALRQADNAINATAATFKYGALRYVGTPGNGYFIAGDPNKPTVAPFGKDGFLSRIYQDGKFDQWAHYVAAERHAGLRDDQKFMDAKDETRFRALGSDPEIRKAAQEWKQFNDQQLQLLVTSGRKTQAEVDRMKDGMYIPFYRISEDADGNVKWGSGGGNVLTSNPELKKLKGSKLPVADALQNIAANVAMINQMAMKNEAMQRVIRDGIQTGYVKQATAASPKDSVVKAFVRGEPKKFEVTDKLLYDSMTFSRQDFGRVVRLAALPGQFLRNMVTLAPAFPIRNIIRDSQMVFAMGYTDAPVLSAIKATSDAVRENANYQLMERMGVVGTGRRGEGPEGTARSLRDSMPKDADYTKYWTQYKELLDKAEAANRLVVFDKLIAQGKSPAQAAFEAREIIDFNRKGANTTVQVLSALIPFQNARIQGVDVLLRAFANNDIPKLKEHLLRRTTAMAAISTAYAFLIQGNEAYQNATEEERDMYWFLPLPNGEAVRVPAPFELSLGMKLLPERLAGQLMQTEDGKVVADSMRRFFLDTLKVDIIPQAIKPGLEVLTNYDFFRQKPIEPEYMKRLEKIDRYEDRTTEMAKILSQYSQDSPVKLSPVQFDKMLRGYSGTIGTYITAFLDSALKPEGKLIPEKPSEVPIFGTLFQRRDGSRKLAEAYELQDAAEQAAASLRFRAKEGIPISPEERERMLEQQRIDKATNGLASRMQAITRIERKVRADLRRGSITSEQARTQLETLRAQKLEIATRIGEVAQRVKQQ